MEERASSSSACSSSTAGWFPSKMKDKPMRVIVRNNLYTGQVIFVDELTGFLQFKLLPNWLGQRPHFDDGDLALLQSKEGNRWWGKIISSIEYKDNKDSRWPSLYTGRGSSDLYTTCLHIRVLPEAEPLESLENLVVTLKPVAKLKRSKEVVKVGVVGFGKTERFLVEMGLQSIDVELVAIHAPMSLKTMVKEWKSPNINVSVKGPRTLIFSRRYYERHPGDKIVNVLTENMEVAVLSEPNKIPWEQANVDFVMECGTLFSKDKDAQLSGQSQVSNMAEDSNSSLRCLPKVLDAFGLYANGIMRTKFHDHETKVRAGKFSIVTSSSAAANAVCHKETFPDWKKDSTSMSFLATAAPAALHRLTDVNTANVNLQVTLVNSENCSGIKRIPTRFCDPDIEVHHRLKAVMSWCVDIIRCAPVGECCLELA